MSPEREVSRESRVQRITRKLKESQNYERPVSRSYTLNIRRTFSSNDLRERRDRFAHDRNDVKVGRVRTTRERKEQTAHDKTALKLTESLRPKRSISPVVTRIVARSLLIGFWWLFLLLWWCITLIPRSVLFVFIKDKRKHKEDASVEKASKKYRVSEERKVRRRNIIVHPVFFLYIFGLHIQKEGWIQYDLLGSEVFCQL